MITVSGGSGVNSPPESHAGNSSVNNEENSHQQRCPGNFYVGGQGSLGIQNTQQPVGNVIGSYHTFNDMTTVTCPHSVSPLHRIYDWDSEENRQKWRGIFARGSSEKPLKKVLSKALLQIHQSPHTNNLPGEISQMTAVDEAWDYVESLLLKLLAMLTARPLPTSKSDVEVPKQNNVFKYQL